MAGSALPFQMAAISFLLFLGVAFMSAKFLLEIALEWNNEKRATSRA